MKKEEIIELISNNEFAEIENKINLFFKDNLGEFSYLYGLLYKEKNYVNHNPKLSFEYILKSFEIGINDASFLLGCYFEIGFGTKIDLEKAFEYFLIASNLNNKYKNLANYKIGDNYSNGIGTNKNIEKAIKYYWESSIQFPKALIRISAICIEDERYEDARFYSEKAIEVGVYEGYINLSYLYLNGLGVRKDIGKSILILEKGQKYLLNNYINPEEELNELNKILEDYKNKSKKVSKNTQHWDPVKEFIKNIK